MPVLTGVPLALHAWRGLQQSDVHACDQCVEDRAGELADARCDRADFSAVEDRDFPGDPDSILERYVREADFCPAMGVDDHVVCFGVAGDGGRGKK